MLHAKPVQQSAVVVQTDPCGWQAAGGWHVPETPASTPRQRSEQHWLPRVHDVEFGRHTPASDAVPASGAVPASCDPVPASLPVMVWHA